MVPVFLKLAFDRVPSNVRLAVEASSKHLALLALVTAKKKSISVLVALIDKEAVLKGISPVVSLGSLLNWSTTLFNLQFCANAKKGMESKSVKKHFISGL